MKATGGDEDVMGNYLPVMLNQSTNNWLLSLREHSIRSWDDLKKVFTDNYMATCEQPSTKYDLEKLHQSSEESTQAPMATMRPLEHWSKRISELVSIGP